MKRGLFILILLVFLTGCAYTQNVPGFSTGKPVIGRGVGLQVQPIKQVFEGDNFQVNLKLYNYNSEPVSGVVKISDGLNDEQFGGVIDPTEQTFSIEGFGEKDPAPPSQEISFEPGPYSLNGVEKLNSNIIIEVLYDYDFVSQSQICLKKKDTKIPKALNCNPSSLNEAQLGRTNLLSPVKVSKIDIQTTETKDGLTVQLVLYIRNDGGGFINNEKETLTDLSVGLIGVGSFNCRPSSVSLKENREGIASCTLKVPLSEGQYTSDPLLVGFKFPYRYVASIDNIEIKKAV